MDENLKYTKAAMFLHWSIAIFIFANLIIIWSTHYIPDHLVRPFINTHKSIGITVLGFVLMRIIWRFRNTPPKFPSTYKVWEIKLSHATHKYLYIIMLALPLSGWIMDSAWKDAKDNPMPYFGLFDWPRLGVIMNLKPVTKESIHSIFGLTHELCAFALYFLIFLHIGGALKHQLWDKEKEIQRMLP